MKIFGANTPPFNNVIRLLNYMLHIQNQNWMPLISNLTELIILANLIKLDGSLECQTLITQKEAYPKQAYQNE